MSETDFNKRLEDWMTHCRAQHEELNLRTREAHAELSQRIKEIHQAVVGNGFEEGVKPRLARHSQQITHIEKDVIALRTDVDDKMEALSKSIGALNIRFWKMALIVSGLVVGINKAVQGVDIKTLIGL